jgi:hypothetical protein
MSQPIRLQALTSRVRTKRIKVIKSCEKGQLKNSQKSICPFVIGAERSEMVADHVINAYRISISKAKHNTRL